MAKEKQKKHFNNKSGKNSEQGIGQLQLDFSVFEEKMNNLNYQLQAIEEAIREMNSIDKGLDEIKNSKGKEILAPLGRGVFVETILKSNKILMDVGGKNFVKKTPDETREIIKKQIKKLGEVKKEIGDNLENLEGELRAIIQRQG